MMKTRSLSFLAFVLLLLLSASPAFAKKPEHAGRPDKRHKDDSAYIVHDFDRREDVRILRFDDDKKRDIRIYMKNDYRRDCPHGLAKKWNRCRPPGHAKRYVVGEHLPSDHYMPPRELIARLGPPPAGAFYAMVDKDVLLASEATKKILDAVTLFSAMD